MNASAEKLNRVILSAMRQVAFEIHAKIVDRTPIDTGRAKASWRLNPDRADTSVEPVLADRPNQFSGGFIVRAAAEEHPLFANQAAAVARAQQQKIPEGTKRIVISNSLDYIHDLENGTSQQAPRGMVLVTIHPGAVEAMFQRAFDERAKPF